MRLSILDDYQGVALDMADWSAIRDRGIEIAVERFPFVPSDRRQRDERCFEAYNIQVHGLVKRLQSSGLQRVVIGISGGLDSSQALIVAAKTMDRLKLPRRSHRPAE